MYRFLYKIYFLRLKNEFIDSLYLRIVVRCANILLPAYFNFTRGNKKFQLTDMGKSSEEKIIVSLTSFPARIKKVWLTIESLLRQNVKPDAIILWLYEGEFDGEASLPLNLIKLKERGLQIRFCHENLMPHNKYYYTILENPHANVVTIDDDIVYPYDHIEKLLEYHGRYPTAICCPVTRQIKFSDGEIMPYCAWRHIMTNTAPDFLNLTMGVGGALFPVGSLHPDAFNKENLIKFALCTDDLWLKIMSLRSGTKVASLAGEYPRFFIPIIHKNNKKLMDDNIGGGGNDRVFRLLMEHYNVNISNFINSGT